MKTSWLSSYVFQCGLVLALGCLLTGCVGVVPVPVYSSTPENGRKLVHGDVAFIHPGLTTRAEVIARIGPDFYWNQRSRSLAYTWEVPGGGGFWWAASMYGGGGDYWVGGWRGFFVSFDNRDLATAVAFKRLSTRRSLDENMERWAAKAPAPKSLQVAKGQQ